MSFSSKRDEVKKRLNCVYEMQGIMESASVMPDDAVYDIMPSLTEGQADGAFISSEKLYEIGVTLRTMESVGSFFRKKGEDGECRFKTLSKEFETIPNFPEITSEINRCIGKFGEVNDNASPGLLEVRRAISAASGSIQRAMRKVLDDAVRRGLVEKDTTPAMRDGRMVIPVSAGSKRDINGIVHDTSATGKTVFIEPASVVEAGNRLRELEREERREIIAILTSLTDMLRPHFNEIEQGCNLLALLDFIKGKAKLAIELECHLPVIEKDIEIDWFHALHPGLMLTLRQQGKTPVALNINLNSKQRILVISGPNAGGKSVCLKTVAVVQYMMQCGMLPTLYSNSHMGVFDDIFIDIGDEQSIENDLSTYSSHLTNMKYFLARAGKKSLVLADEMGSGTEPQIGGALAQAILIQLGRSGCLGVVTTHYHNIKTFAENEEGFVNGAMLYDRQNLRPTFQLSVGTPGSSFALEIARNIGLPRDVIEEARNLVGSEYVNIDKYLLDIQRDRRYWQNKRLSIKEKEHKLDKLLETYESSSSDLKTQRSAILKAAKEEAKEILAGANAQIERSIHEIRKAEAERQRTLEIRKELDQYRKDLEKSGEEDKDMPKVLKPLRHKSKKSKEDGNKRNNLQRVAESKGFEVGDYVKMADSGVAGQILSINGKKAEVAFGGLRTIVGLDKLKSSSKPKDTVKQTSFTVTSSSGTDESRQRQLKFKNDIDVRGMRADEALQAVTYFLDDAVQFNAGRVRILHGTGHGILKTLIRQQLKSNPNVTDFHDEDVRFGGAGITVIDLG